MSCASDPKPVVTGYPAAAPSPAGRTSCLTAGTTYHYPFPRLYVPPHRNGAAPPPSPYGFLDPIDTLFIRLLYTATAFFLFVCLVCVILWIVLQPPVPVFAVSSASVSAFNLSVPKQLLSSSFDLKLSVRNPDHKMGLHYEHLAAAVFYGPDNITRTYLPPFYQDKQNATTIQASLVAAAEYVDADVAKSIADDRGSGSGIVNFQVKVLGRVRFNLWKWSSGLYVMNVYCDYVPIRFSNGTATVGSLVTPPKDCKVTF